MLSDERTAWDERYRKGPHEPRQPDAFFVRAYREFVHPLFPRGGTALDVAGGAGRHAIFLARHGWRVTLNDISPVGLDRAHRHAAQRGVTLDYLPGNTRDASFGRARFDLVLVFFYLERGILPRIKAALRPGGLVIYKTYTREHAKFSTHGTAHPTYFLEPGELLRFFSRFRVLHYEETVRDAADREKGTAQLIARKA
ncbi:MAG: class I SAM-dependent methyltransferase [Terriglobales bacterium]